MTQLGRHDGDPLVVDLRSTGLQDPAALWDALAAPCGLPEWFGRNLNAWWDTIQAGAISEVLDAHNGLVVLLPVGGMFAPGNEAGAAFVEVTNRSDHAEARVEPIFHLALAADWDEAVSSGAPYRQSTLGRSLDDVGFIHCSFAEQVQGVADMAYQGRTDVVLLAIDVAGVADQMKVEDLEGTGRRFPHLYGELPVETVIHAAPVPLDDDDDGRLVLRDLLEQWTAP